VALMGFILRRFVDEQTSWLAMALTLACPVFLGLGGAVATDMLLAAFVAGGVLVYLAFALETEQRLRRHWSLLLFALLAGGFLTKGPVALALFGMPVLAWTILYRKWDLLRDHAWGRGILLFLALVVPWFWLCEIRNPGFLEYFFVNENFLRFVTPNYGDRYGNGHIYPRGSALVMLLLATMPWSPYALWLGWQRRRGLSLRPGNQMVGLLFLGFLVPALFWCLARQLLITYLLPMVPLFCAWLALVLPRGGLLRRYPGRAMGAVLGTVAVLGCTAGPKVCARRSAKGIVRSAKMRVGAMLIFARRVPYSAYFYGRGIVFPHPKCPVVEATRLALSMQDSAVLVMKGCYLEDIPDGMAQQLRQVATAGRYALLVTEDQ
jgi:4-amino-4-deoxy-L-arabinose transferase-like glycosyltransferase